MGVCVGVCKGVWGRVCISVYIQVDKSSPCNVWINCSLS